MLNMPYNISFKGAVVVKGSVKEIRNVEGYYDEAFFANDVFSKGYDLRRNPKVFEGFEAFSLTGIYDRDQKYAEHLFVTNKDVDTLVKYHMLKDEMQKRKYNKELQTNKSSLDMMISTLQHLIEIERKREPYLNSLQNQNSHNNFLIDLYKKSQKTLAEIFGEKDALNIPRMKAEEILDAIKNKKWDFVNCKIIK